MNNLSDVAAGASYVTSIGSGGYWLLTYLTNLYFKIKEDRRKARDYEQQS
ncbi:lysis S family protein [Klebsiella pneumoniae]|nr:lysis S family protein [Klebsiella pneumoniae]